MRTNRISLIACGILLATAVSSCYTVGPPPIATAVPYAQRTTYVRHAVLTAPPTVVRHVSTPIYHRTPIYYQTPVYYHSPIVRRSPIHYHSAIAHRSPVHHHHHHHGRTSYRGSSTYCR